MTDDRDELVELLEAGEFVTLDQALSLAVCGYKMRHDGMGVGNYIYYQFNGWRIQFTHDGVEGSSSGWSPYDGEDKANWYEYQPPAPVAEPWPDAPAPVEPVTRRRRSKAPLPPVNDIGDWQAAPVKPIVNPWADAGIGASAPKQEGWASYGKAD